MKRVFFILFMIGGTAAAAVAQQKELPPVPEATRLYVEGIKELRIKGNGQRAAVLLDSVLRLDSTHLGALLEMGRVEQAYRIDSADKFVRERYTRFLAGRRRYDEALKITPDDIESLLGAADAARQRGDEPQMLALIKRLMQDRRITPRMKADLFEDITRDRAFYGRNYTQIAALARLLMADSPHEWSIVNLYATSLLASGQTREGIEVYKNYITDTTSLKEPWQMVIDGEAFLKNADSVRLWADRAIARFPDDTDLRMRKGGAMAYLELPDEAMAAYHDALDHASTDSLRSEAHALIGAQYAAQKQESKAVKEYQKSIALNPDNVLALNNLAYSWAEQGRNLERALKMAQRVMELEPDNATYVDTHGWILFRMGRLEDAKRVLRQAVSRESDAELMLHYAEVLKALGEEFMAKYYQDKAKELEAKSEE